MDIVLDTCIFIRNDKNQNPVPDFNYDFLDQLLNDKGNNLFVTGFSLPEIFMLRHYENIDDLIAGLALETVYIASYNFSALRKNFDGFDIINKYSAVMFYHLTEFLEFFVLEITHPFHLDDIDSFCRTVHGCTELFHKKIGQTNLENCTVFMKNKAIDYIVECIKMIFKNYGKIYSDYEIWDIIAKAHVGSFLARNTDVRYLRYGRFLIELFALKLQHHAKRIKLNFGFNDLLIAHATESNFIVVSSDRDMCRYLLKYGNDKNKIIIDALWNGKLLPAGY